ncbi:helix-turn-helix transcriptional regulator [Catellatospora sp. KI3]|uniref:helix-turn-helix domain-containing protein n=1 Tax=Catellatospora sp. KI3 TaxID=3041620 RepID=UPI0024828E06|nr:helix-turn-helix transcriptional regulator [Catellatospora sp. KI3]MDI1462985.1 helix-turn-helix transcriptional regulator [Catellatospora sp. KI3]
MEGGNAARRSFGTELRRLRLEAGISLSELARRVHYSKGYLSRVEAGQRSPSGDLAHSCDAALQTNGSLSALLEASQQEPAGQPSAVVTGQQLPEALPTSATTTIDAYGASDSLHAFREMLDNLRQLGQTLSPSSIIPILHAHIGILLQMSSRVDPASARDTLLLTARFAEFLGWMEQERGDDAAALRWTDEAVRCARAGNDVDMIAYAFVRRANIALYQQDAYGTISFARTAQSMECSRRVMGLAVQREAQGHALAHDYSSFRDCISRAAVLLSGDSDDRSNLPVLGPTRIPNSVALAEGWSLHDLGRSQEAVQVLTPLFDSTPKGATRARARIGARLALALATVREIDAAYEVLKPILVQFPEMESATIRGDLRRLTRVLNRWSGEASVQRFLPELSAALNPVSSFVSIPAGRPAQTIESSHHA